MNEQGGRSVESPSFPSCRSPPRTACLPGPPSSACFALQGGAAPPQDVTSHGEGERGLPTLLHHLPAGPVRLPLDSQEGPEDKQGVCAHRGVWNPPPHRSTESLEEWQKAHAMPLSPLAMGCRPLLSFRVPQISWALINPLNCMESTEGLKMPPSCQVGWGGSGWWGWLGGFGSST